MNISQIKQLQAVDGWIDFSAQITEVKETKVRTKKNRLMTKVKLKDETDEIGAWLYSDLQQITPGQLIVANGMLKEYESRRYIDYATVKTTQPAPQNAQQGTPQAAQATNGKEKVDWDAKELREKRGYAIRDAVLVKTTLASVSNNIATHLSENSIFELAEKFVKYVYSGIDTTGGTPPLGGNPAPAESKRMAREFEADMEREQIDPNYEQARANQPPF